MRIALVGGTRFIRRALLAELLSHGHEVLVVHRGEHEPAGLPQAPHLHVDRRELASRGEELWRFRPDALVDLAAATARDCEAVLDVVDERLRLLVVSSMDVYRAYASLWAAETTDALPLSEEAVLREEPPPDQRGPAPEGWDIDMSEYDKLDVERAYLTRGATVCRLPFVYGEHDYNRHEEFVLRRIRVGRPRMPIGPRAFLGSRGYAPELARGLRLALEADAGGGVFNLCEATCAPIGLWAEQIVAAAGAELELVPTPAVHLPADLALTGDVSQHLLVDATRAERRLGWVHRSPENCLERSVAWHLAHPPDAPDDDFEADDRALRAAAPPPV